MENQKKHPSNIDVAVLMLFFSRADLFGKVFEQVRKARPSKLFLYQDGAREGNERDKEGIAACRAICADDQIDWECEVYRHYCDHNQGSCWRTTIFPHNLSSPSARRCSTAMSTTTA